MPLNRPPGPVRAVPVECQLRVVDGWRQDRICQGEILLSTLPITRTRVHTHTLSGPPSHFVAMLAFSLALSHLALGLSLLCRAPHWAAPDAYLVSPGKESHSTLLTGT